MGAIENVQTENSGSFKSRDFKVFVPVTINGKQRRIKLNLFKRLKCYDSKCRLPIREVEVENICFIVNSEQLVLKSFFCYSFL